MCLQILAQSETHFYSKANQDGNRFSDRIMYQINYISDLSEYACYEIFLFVEKSHHNFRESDYQALISTKQIC